MNILGNISDAIGGVAFGYVDGLFYAKEHEVKQGKNYVIASFPQSIQVSAFSNVLSHISSATLPRVPNFSMQVFCNVAPIVSIPVTYAMAYVKQNGYEAFAKGWNENPFLPGKFPERLEPATHQCVTTVCGFFAEYLGDMIAVAMVVSAVALMALGQPFLGGGILAALLYTMIDQWGYIPYEMSLFVETYMPIVQILGAFFAGTPLAILTGLLMAPAYIFPEYSAWFQSGIDRLLHNVGVVSCLSLDELEAPLVKKHEMSFEEIKEILDGSSDDYELNPAHYGKWAYDLSKLPQEDNFDQYIEMFNKIDWEDRYQVIATNLGQDERFIDEILAPKFPTIDKAELSKEAVITYIPQLASQLSISKEKFVANHVKKEMKLFVDIHMKRVRVAGSQQDLYDSIEWQKKILPMLKALKDKDSIQYEDALLTLAIAGGGYCGRGQKNTSSNLFHDLLLSVEIDTTELSPTEAYELKLSMALQNERYKVIQHFYDLMMKAIHMPDSIKKDVHGFDLYRILLAMGFYPLTEYERRSLGIDGLMMWEYYGGLGIREFLYKQYETGATLELDDFGVEVRENYDPGIKNAINSVGGKIAIAPHLTQMIENNTRLNEQEKLELKEILLNNDPNDEDGFYFANQSNYEASVQRLLFVMMGIMRKKSHEAIEASGRSRANFENFLVNVRT